MTSKRVEIVQYCEIVCNTVTTQVNRDPIIAGKTAILFTPYWYVKYARDDKPEVALFTNPLDWLAYMEQFASLEAWREGSPKDCYGADNPVFARMQWLTKEVEAGKQFVHKDMRIWASAPLFGGDDYTYHISNGKNKRTRGFGQRMKRQWKTAIKPYLWDWTEDVSG